tara:strand:- start:38 stop:274 length:237 start_codon:yes stop_codon:yes gene_type:complete
MDIDAVIVEVEFQMESNYEPFGHFICLRFIDVVPTLNKLDKFVKQLSQFDDVRLVDYDYIVKPITEKTDLGGMDFIKH